MNDSLKSEQRRLARARRRAFVAERGHSRFPTALLRQHLALSPCTIVASYAAVAGEPDMSDVEAMLRSSGVVIAHPRIDGDIMTFRLTGDQRPDVSALGFMQPPSDAPVITPAVILAPLVGFDRQMNRLGQGGGHYDRAFVALPHARRIGIAWSAQLLPRVTCDPWDGRLHAIVTEKEWIE